MTERASENIDFTLRASISLAISSKDCSSSSMIHRRRPSAIRSRSIQFYCCALEACGSKLSCRSGDSVANTSDSSSGNRQSYDRSRSPALGSRRHTGTPLGTDQFGSGKHHSDNVKSHADVNNLTVQSSE